MGGAGLTGLTPILTQAGCSGKLHKAEVLYSKHSSSHLTDPAGKHVSAAVALSAAKSALFSSVPSCPLSSSPAGLAATTVLPTDGSSNTHCRSYVALATLWSCELWSLDLNGLPRPSAYDAVGDLVGSLVSGSPVAASVPPPASVSSGPEWAYELLTSSPHPLMIPTVPSTLPASVTLLPGSFNPLHSGHVSMLRHGAPSADEGWLELSVANVDKPTVTLEDARARLDGLGGRRAVLSNCATFERKMEALGGRDVEFRVGGDTVVRVFDKKYYGGDEREMEEAAARIREGGGRFLAFGRGKGKEVEREGVAWAEGWEEVDVSSSEIRRGEKGTGL